MKEEGLDIKRLSMNRLNTTLIKKPERMQFNFKRHNTVQRKLNYDHVL